MVSFTCRMATWNTHEAWLARTHVQHAFNTPGTLSLRKILHIVWSRPSSIQVTEICKLYKSHTTPQIVFFVLHKLACYTDCIMLTQFSTFDIELMINGYLYWITQIISTLLLKVLPRPFHPPGSLPSTSSLSLPSRIVRPEKGDGIGRAVRQYVSYGPTYPVSLLLAWLFSLDWTCQSRRQKNMGTQIPFSPSNQVLSSSVTVSSSSTKSSSESLKNSLQEATLAQ